MDVTGRPCGGCCPGCHWWCLIANVVEGVAYRVSPVSPLGLLGFLGCCWLCLIAGVAGRCRGGSCVGVAGGVRSRIWVGGVVLG